MGRGNKLEGQKKGPWGLAERERQGKCTSVKWVGKTKGMLCKDSQTGSSVLKVFIWSSQRWVLVEYFSAFQVCPFEVPISTDLLMQRQGSLVIATSPDSLMVLPFLILLLFWAWSWSQLRPRCYLQLNQNSVSVINRTKGQLPGSFGVGYNLIVLRT